MAPSRRVWLIGGTGESVELAIVLSQAAIPCLITVTTESARHLYPNVANLTVFVGRLTPVQMAEFVQQQGISAIVDASHPFAAVVSENAIAISQQFKLPYLRFERPQIDVQNASHILAFPNFKALLESQILAGKRVLLTLGYQSLPLFQTWHQKATLFTRILPSTIALETALAAGFPPQQIIALRPPISAELELALWQQWQINCVVTKASGKAGGEDIKRQIAEKMGIPLAIITRPSLNYPQQSNRISDAILWVKSLKN